MDHGRQGMYPMSPTMTDFVYDAKTDYKKELFRLYDLYNKSQE